MANLVVRGLATDNTVVTAGLGPDAGERFTKGLTGAITMFGTLVANFILGGGGEETQGGTSIDIDIGID